MSQIQVQMIDNTVSSDWWRKLVQHFVKVGDELEIRCWKEETAEIQQASLYGKPVSEKHEVSIKGTVTTKLLAELSADESVDRSVYILQSIPKTDSGSLVAPIMAQKCI